MQVRQWPRPLVISLAFALSMSTVLALGAQAQPTGGIDWSAVEQALGRTGQMMARDVFRIGMPRSDLKVTVEDVPVQAGSALGSYAAFKAMDNGQALVMGDLVARSRR
jgi:hypothetical protein